MRLTLMVLAMLGGYALGVCARKAPDSSSPKTNMMYSPQTDPLLLSTRNRKIRNIDAARRDSRRGIPLGRRGY